MIELIRAHREILALVVLLAVSLIVSVLTHWLVICRTLYQHGARFPTGLFFWRAFHELRRYKDVLSAKGRPLTFYYFAFILAWFNLLLALGIALRLLWKQSHPF